MKLIIIEGTDNTGKDTLISKILERYSITTIIHCGKPKSKTNPSSEQDNLFEKYANSIVNKYFDNSDVIIMNRSHIGEYVYGTLYRGRSLEEVEKMISHINDILNYNKYLDVYYIQLICTSAELLNKNDDEKSLSNGCADRILKEFELFLDIFNKVNLNKKLIYVNDGDQFRLREDIFNEAINFINS